ncbi:MAG: uL13 family ribosomal protein [Planctomycetales bacterium]|nr:uL13 family ribosomal protein [Planctomycetales bacterium]
MLAIGKTWMAKKEESDNHEWYVIDADAHIVGRLASRIATVLMGKHKPNYLREILCSIPKCRT